MQERTSGDQVHAAFRFVGTALDPADLTARLGIEPSKAHRKGEAVPSDPSRRHPVGYWGIDSQLAEDAPLEAHLSYLIDQLASKAEVLAGLRADGHEGNLYCSLFMSRQTSRVHLGASALSRIGALGLSLTVDIYHWSTEDGGQDLQVRTN